MLIHHNMNNFINNNKQKIFVVLSIVLFVICALAIYYGGFGKAKIAILGGERVVNETPTPRTVDKVTIYDVRSASKTGESVPLVSREHITIEDGKTLKEGFAIAEPVALEWAEDAKLVYIRSLGTVTVEGISSGWEVAFGSTTSKNGYMISVVNGLVAGKKEISTMPSGYALPTNWYDAGDAVKSIQTLPQFSESTISGINFYYNEDGKKWGYAISSSNGTVSVPVR